MKTYKIFSAVVSVLLCTCVLGGCAQSSVSKVSSAASDSSDGTVTLKGIVDLTPHSEIINYIKDDLKKKGITIELVSTMADATTNQRLSSGEIDFNYFQHLPYLESYNATNGDSLISAGAIHIEPIAAYSKKYGSLKDIPDDAELSVVIPNDVTNEYRALSILEKQGWIELDKKAKDSLSADTTDITAYKRKIKITEIDSAQIIGMASDFDIYIVNTNKALEAGIDTTKYLFHEDAKSPYANIIAIRAKDKDNPAIKELVAELKSDKVKKFIEQKYKGAVIPAED